MDNIKIIPITKEYVDAAADIAVIAWESVRIEQKKLLGEKLYNMVFDNWQEEKRNGIKANLEKGNGFVALINDKVVGFASYFIENDHAEIRGNGVLPECRGMGIATKLHNKTMELFKEKGLKYAFVHTGLDDGHAPARKAYGKVGFTLNLPHVEYYMELDKNTKKEVFDDLEIIPYDEKYLDKILTIALDSWKTIHNTYKELIGEKLYSMVYKNWEDKLKESTTNLLSSEKGFVALYEGKVAGYAIYRKNEDKKLGIFSYNSVSNEFRGKRIAARLYNHIKIKMLEDGCELAKVLTGLDDAHAPARRAYENTGFEKNLPSITYYMEL